jgi:hypothetical protein
VGLEDIELENVSLISQNSSRGIGRPLPDPPRRKETYVTSRRAPSSVDNLMPFRLLPYIGAHLGALVEEAGSKLRRMSTCCRPYPRRLLRRHAENDGGFDLRREGRKRDAFAGFVPNFSYHLMVLGKRTSEELLPQGRAGRSALLRQTVEGRN